MKEPQQTNPSGEAYSLKDEGYDAARAGGTFPPTRALRHFGSLAAERKLYRAWFILCLFSLIGSSPSPPAAQDAATPAVVQRGTELYRAASCGTCHTLAAADTRGAFGPTHDGLRATVERHLKDGSYSGRATTVRAYLKESIVDPAAFIVPEYAGSRYLMPAYTDLTEAELDTLVTLLARP